MSAHDEWLLAQDRYDEEPERDDDGEPIECARCGRAPCRINHELADAYADAYADEQARRLELALGKGWLQ
jgi:hypothetical protein